MSVTSGEGPYPIHDRYLMERNANRNPQSVCGFCCREPDTTLFLCEFHQLKN